MPFEVALAIPPGALGAATAGPVAAFDAIYADAFPVVWRTLRRFGVEEAQLDDAAQDVFLVVHRRLPEFEGRSTVRTWVVGIAVGVARNYRRSARRRATEPLHEEPAASRPLAAEERTDAARAARLVRRLLGEMDPDRADVFVLGELEQLTAPEISVALGVNVNTVYSRLRAARRDFEDALARHRASRPE